MKKENQKMMDSLESIAIVGPNEELKERIFLDLIENDIPRVVLTYIDLSEPAIIDKIGELEFVEEIYDDKKVEIVNERCNNCEKCIEACSFGAIRKIRDTISVVDELCTGCSSCFYTCELGAIRLKTIKSAEVRVRRYKSRKIVTVHIKPGSFEIIPTFDYVFRLSMKLSEDHELRKIYVLGNFPLSIVRRFLRKMNRVIVTAYCTDDIDLDEVRCYSEHANVMVVCDRYSKEVIKEIKKYIPNILLYNNVRNLFN